MTTTIAIDGLPPIRKMDRRMRLGCALMPSSVTHAWYANGCAPRFNPLSRVPLRDYVAWLASCLLRRTWRSAS